jgi:hypothetical protein
LTKLASRRRRRKSIGKVVVDVEKRMRRVEKRPGARRLKNNVVTNEKIGYRAVRTKSIAEDAVTANEAEFGVNVVSNTDPDIIKDGTTVTDPDTGETKVYSDDLSAFVTVTDATATAAADDAYDLADSKNTVYRQDDAPTGGTYKVNDVWIDTNDGNKLYVWNGTSWVSAQDASIATAQSAATAAQATANGKNKVYYSTSTPGSTANTAGDIWWQYSGGVIIAQWTGAGGTSWTSNTLGNAVIANLDAGKITTGILNVAGTVKISTATSGSRVELTPLGFFAYNGSTPTVSILAADGSAEFTGRVYGSRFESTGYTAGTTGVALAPSGSGNTIFFRVSGSDVGNITAVSTGIVVSSGSSQLVMSTAGAVVLSGAFNSLTFATAPYLSTSGANTAGAYGSLRNTFASSAAPSDALDGVNGDVWLRWA